jgi:hypothetical protein
MVYLMTLLGTQVIKRHMMVLLMNNELKRLWKESFIKFEYYPCIFL